MKTMVKLNELRFELLLVSNDYWVFADLENILQEKRFGSNEEVIAEVEAYFKGKDKSTNLQKGIENLAERWYKRIIFDGECLDE